MLFLALFASYFKCEEKWLISGQDLIFSGGNVTFKDPKTNLENLWSSFEISSFSTQSN